MNTVKAGEAYFIFQRLRGLLNDRKYEEVVLGDLSGESLYLYTKGFNSHKKNILITAGFHGDEPAGVWGILHFLLNTDKAFINKINISFIPSVNPTGLKRGSRINIWNEDPNRGFCHTDSGNYETSKEGSILINNLQYLLGLSKDGFLSLHEDTGEWRFYAYIFEALKIPLKDENNNIATLSQILYNTGLKYFPIYLDSNIIIGKVNNGMVSNACDGSFEDLLFHSGIWRTVCTETPGQTDIHLRMKANSDIIKTFAKYIVDIKED